MGKRKSETTFQDKHKNKCRKNVLKKAFRGCLNVFLSNLFRSNGHTRKGKSGTTFQGNNKNMSRKNKMPKTACRRSSSY